MKRLILISITLVLATINLSAQPGLSTGIGGMFGSSWIINQNAWGNPELEYAPTMGYQYNGVLGFWVNENISFQIEPGMSRMGQFYEGKMSTLDARREIRLNYFSFPLLFRYTGNGDAVRFHALAGPQINFLSGAEHYFDCTATFPYYLQGFTDVTDRFSSTDLLMVLDIGADFFLSDEFFLSAGFRMNYGLSDINSELWRIPNNSNIYEASHNFIGGLHIGFNYLFF